MKLLLVIAVLSSMCLLVGPCSRRNEVLQLGDAALKLNYQALDLGRECLSLGRKASVERDAKKKLGILRKRNTLIERRNEICRHYNSLVVRRNILTAPDFQVPLLEECPLMDLSFLEKPEPTP